MYYIELDNLVRNC